MAPIAKEVRLILGGGQGEGRLLAELSVDAAKMAPVFQHEGVFEALSLAWEHARKM